jgi:ATP-dependent Lon protease
MGDLEDLTRLPDDFDGRVRLFPLPSFVLFPHAMQPLHVFEPRYCEMLADALKGDELITMATLVGGVAMTKDRPPTAPTVCIGRIVSHVEREDERHNILLVGIRRARIINEIDAGRPFRIASVEVLDDLYPPTGLNGRSELRSKLLAAFAKVIPSTESVQQGLDELQAGSMALGPITDIISHTLPLAASLKLQLLAEADVDRRAGQLIEFLDSGAVSLQAGSDDQTPQNSASDSSTPRRMPFPPPFSLN